MVVFRFSLCRSTGVAFLISLVVSEVSFFALVDFAHSGHAFGLAAGARFSAAFAFGLDAAGLGVARRLGRLDAAGKCLGAASFSGVNWAEATWWDGTSV